MLTAIKIGNFKAFADAQRIPISPLTLIYGANSSGKSSILHSLLLARHAVESGELDVRQTSTGGEAVDLGGFKQYVYGRDTDLRVHLEWEISSKGFSKKLIDLLPSTKKAAIGINIGLSFFDKSLMDKIGELTPRQLISVAIDSAKKRGDQAEADRLTSELNESDDQLTIEEISKLWSEVRVTSCWLDLDSQRFLSTSARTEGHLQLDFLDREHAAIRYLIENLILANSTTDKVDQEEVNAMEDTIDSLVPYISFQTKELFYLNPSSISPSLTAVRKETRLDDLKSVVKNNLPRIMQEILAGISQSIKQEIERITYLGPLRTYPPRHVGIHESNDPNWVAGGGYAWDLVKKDVRIRQKLNDWLGDDKKLSTSYEVRIRNLLTIENVKAKLTELSSKAIVNMYDALEDSMKDEGVYRDVYSEMEEALLDIPDRIEKLETLFSDTQEVTLFDKRSKTPVSHRDVGIGISQVLPVLVTCFASTGKIIATEQPEIHLHPALQAELGDVFIESALGDRKNKIIIESHSEHILLRIMRRIRETTTGKLPAEFPPVHHEDVMVLYVEPDGPKSIVREMPLNESGELVKAWPGGFFEEGLREIF